MTTKAAAPPHEHDEESVDPLDETLLDPLDPRIVSRDIFELYCYEMIMEENEVRRRAFLVAKMKVSFISLLENRIYCVRHDMIEDPAAAADGGGGGLLHCDFSPLCFGSRRHELILFSYARLCRGQE